MALDSVELDHRQMLTAQIVLKIADQISTARPSRTRRARQIGHRAKLVPYHTHPLQGLSQGSRLIAGSLPLDRLFVVDLLERIAPSEVSRTFTRSD